MLFSMLFCALSVLAYLRFEDEGGARWYLGALGLFLLALLSKTSVVMIPVVLLGCAWWRRGKIERPDLLRTAPFFGLSLVLGLVTVWFMLYGPTLRPEVPMPGFAGRLAGAGWSVWFYIYKALLPLRLNMIYPRWKIDGSSAASFIPLALLAGCFLLAWRYRQRWGRPVLFALGYFVVTLLPVLGFINSISFQCSFVADHWQYISIIGLIAFVIGGTKTLVERHLPGRLRWLHAAAAVLVCALFILTWRQARIYGDFETLCHDTIAKNPDAWVAHAKLADLRIREGRYDDALAASDTALRLNPTYSKGYHRRGLAYWHKGMVQEAIENYTRAIELNPNDLASYVNRAVAYDRLGRYEAAIADCSQALEIEPDNVSAYHNRGAIYEKLRRFSPAVQDYSRAIDLAPDSGEIYRSRALCYHRLGEYDKAWADVRTCRKLGVRVHPGFIAELSKASGKSP